MTMSDTSHCISGREIILVIVRGLMKFVTADAYQFCLNLPSIFPSLQEGAGVQVMPESDEQGIVTAISIRNPPGKSTSS